MTNPPAAREFTRVREDNLERLVTGLKNAHKTRELVLASGMHFTLVAKIGTSASLIGGTLHVQHQNTTTHHTLSDERRRILLRRPWPSSAHDFSLHSGFHHHSDAKGRRFGQASGGPAC